MSDAPRDFGRELYPFLYQASGEDRDSRVAGAMADARRSTLDKCRDVVAARSRFHAEYRAQLVAVATEMADAFERGGKLLAFGNGGSATDAQDAAADCLAPAMIGWRPLPALALTNDVGVLTAVANDVGFEQVFARQLVAFGAAGDIALGFSTSGGSPSVAAAFVEAKRRRMLTVALVGYDGGSIAQAGVDHCFVARLDYVPRIQEVHATVWHTLLDLVQARVAERAA